jgi:hypothetical protein
LFNNETITWNVIAGLIIVLISVALVSNIRVGLPMPKHGVD